eukprot:82599-Pyramimonas_sp.AAC.1
MRRDTERHVLEFAAYVALLGQGPADTSEGSEPPIKHPSHPRPPDPEPSGEVEEPAGPGRGRR